MEVVYEKPVIVFYKERLKKPQRRAFAVIKARRLAVSRAEKGFRGSIRDFFPLMGTLITFLQQKECLIAMSYAGLTMKKMTSKKLGDD